MNRIVLGDNIDVLPTIEDGAAAMIYIDPPFNTGKAQRRERLRTVRDDEHGDRTGFQGKRYRTVRLGAQSFDDMFDDFLAFLEPRLIEAYRILSPSGSFFLHIDYREAHYCKVLLDALFGRECFMNEIIWAYDYGGRPKNRWPAKHDTLLWYVKDPARYTFHHDAIDRVPYMAPGLAGAEKAARGKIRRRTCGGKRSCRRWGASARATRRRSPSPSSTASCACTPTPSDLVLDFFAGSGTTGEAAARNGRRYLLIDSNSEAVRVMAERLAFSEPEVVGG